MDRNAIQHNCSLESILSITLPTMNTRSVDEPLALRYRPYGESGNAVTSVRLSVSSFVSTVSFEPT